MGSSSNAVTEILKSCENLLGVYSVISGTGESLELVPIKEFYNEFSNRKRTDKEVRDICVSCGYYMASLSYTKDGCNFQRISVLDFSEYTRVDLLCDLLVPFLKRENITTNVQGNIISVVKYLELLEEQDKKFRHTLSYRYLRLFVAYILIGSYSHASMIADFLLQQIFLGENVDNAVRQKIDDLLNARKSIDLMSERYVEKNTGTMGMINKTSNILKKAGKTVDKIFDTINDISPKEIDEDEEKKSKPKFSKEHEQRKEDLRKQYSTLDETPKKKQQETPYEDDGEFHESNSFSEKQFNEEQPSGEEQQQPKQEYHFEDDGKFHQSNFFSRGDEE